MRTEGRIMRRKFINLRYTPRLCCIFSISDSGMLFFVVTVKILKHLNRIKNERSRYLGGISR